MYTIRSCKICKQKIHIRPKGSLLQIRNKCPHITCELISQELLNDMTVPLNLIPDLPNVTIKPYLCTKHGTRLDFKHEIGRFTDMYFCKECHKIDQLIPTQYIKWWKKKTWNKHWKAGDVKFTVSPDYKTMMGL